MIGGCLRFFLYLLILALLAWLIFFPPPFLQGTS